MDHCASFSFVLLPKQEILLNCFPVHTRIREKLFYNQNNNRFCSLDSVTMSQGNLDQQVLEYIEYHRNRGYDEIAFEQLDVVISAQQGRAVRSRLICPQSNISHIGAFVFISPDYEYIKNRILRRKPVSDSQEFTDLRGNVLYSVSVWDMDRDNDELDLYQPDGFWIQRVTLKINHATGDDFSHEYEFICAPSPPPPREHQHFGMFQL